MSEQERRTTELVGEHEEGLAVLSKLEEVGRPDTKRTKNAPVRLDDLVLAVLWRKSWSRVAVRKRKKEREEGERLRRRGKGRSKTNCEKWLIRQSYLLQSVRIASERADEVPLCLYREK